MPLEEVKFNESPESVNSSQSVESTSGDQKKIAPYLLLISIMVENLDAINGFEAQGVMPLGQAIAKLNEMMSQGWITLMDGQVAAIKQAISQGGDDLNAKVNLHMASFNLYNTQNSQSSSAFSAMTNVNGQTSSTVAQAVSTNNQLLQQGPIGILVAIQQVV